MNLDHRQHPYRDDLAAAYLAGHVEATRFEAGERRQIAKGVVNLHKGPDGRSPQDSQLLCGEFVTVYDEADGWAWVQNDTDGYVGYIAADSMIAEQTPPTHSIITLRSHLYPEPDIKVPPIDLLSFSSPVTIVEEEPKFGRLAQGGWIYLRHLAPLDSVARDYVETALTFLGSPYLWGGRSSLGLDCSALVQLSLARAGVACPRDSDQQAASVGEALPLDEPAQRGDLLYSRGHVAIALDAERVVHSNAYYLSTVIEPLRDLLVRIEQESGQGLTVRRRPYL